MPAMIMNIIFLLTTLGLLVHAVISGLRIDELEERVEKFEDKIQKLETTG